MSNSTQTTAQPASAPDLDSFLHAQLPPAAFWERYLVWIGKNTNARGAILWWYDEQTDELRADASKVPPALQATLRQRSSSEVSHVYRAMTSDEIVLEELVFEEEEQGALAVSHAIRHGSECLGAVELLYPGDADVSGILRVVEKALEAIGSSWTRLQEKELASRDAAEYWKELEEFIYRINNAETIGEFADQTVNDGRVLLGADRLSCAIKTGRRVRLQSVSGQATVNRRSEEVRTLELLAHEALVIDGRLLYQVGSEDFPPRILELFTQHTQKTGARLIIVQPIYRYAGADDSRSIDLREQSQDVKKVAIGCLIVENFRERSLPEDRNLLLNYVADHAGATLGRIQVQEEILFRPLRRRLGSMVGYFRGRRLAKVLLALVSLAVVATSLALIPCTYRVEAEGQLMPTSRQHLFSPADAVVRELRTYSGDEVRAGETLLVLFDEELHEELVRKRNEKDELKQSALSLKSRIEQATRSADRQREVELRGELAETMLRIESLADDISILSERESQLTICAPFDGVVTTFQLKERLLNRPVARGDLLIEIADETQDWQLELQLPEYRLGHLLEAIQTAPKQGLPVEYVLATDVDRTYTGSLKREAIATRAEVDQERGTIVQLNVETDIDQLASKRIGAVTTAKISCHESTLAYVVFGDVWEFFRRHLWF